MTDFGSGFFDSHCHLGKFQSCKALKIDSFVKNHANNDGHGGLLNDIAVLTLTFKIQGTNSTTVITRTKELIYSKFLFKNVEAHETRM